MDPKVTLTDLTGRAYGFSICNMALPFNHVPGLYSFVRLAPAATRVLSGLEPAVFYVGESADLEARLRDHEKWRPAVQLGATHVVALYWPGLDFTRLAAERSLIGRYNPPLNDQHRTDQLRRRPYA